MSNVTGHPVDAPNFQQVTAFKRREKILEDNFNMENNFATMSEGNVTRHPVDAPKSLKIFSR